MLATDVVPRLACSRTCIRAAFAGPGGGVRRIVGVAECVEEATVAVRDTGIRVLDTASIVCVPLVAFPVIVSDAVAESVALELDAFVGDSVCDSTDGEPDADHESVLAVREAVRELVRFRLIDGVDSFEADSDKVGVCV